MKRILLGLIALFLCGIIIYFFEFDRIFSPSMTPQEAFEKLIEGNKRYIENKTINSKHPVDMRAGLVGKQRPFAVILGCSDSRVPPELLFDQNIGDVFVVRVAGNVAGSIEQESISYAIHQLKSKLIIVLGHENCGAVTAVLKGQTEGIEAIADLIRPVIKECKGDCNEVEAAVKKNVKAVVRQLRNDPRFYELISSNKLDVIGGYYYLKSGKVDFLERED